MLYWAASGTSFGCVAFLSKLFWLELTCNSYFFFVMIVPYPELEFSGFLTRKGMFF